MSNQGNILSALKARLESITVANGYPITVTTVEKDVGVLTMDINGSKLPYIEIINGGDTVINQAMTGLLQSKISITLRIVKNKSALYDDMAVFQACVLRCLFGNSYTVPQDNAKRLPYNGVELLTRMEYLNSDPDFNMIKVNRIWDINIDCYYVRNVNQF